MKNAVNVNPSLFFLYYSSRSKKILLLESV